MNDPIVEEIHKCREQYAARFNFDLAAICEDLRRRTAESDREVVSRPARKAPTPANASRESS